jgi:hypothetical protein
LLSFLNRREPNPSEVRLICPTWEFGFLAFAVVDELTDQGIRYFEAVHYFLRRPARVSIHAILAPANSELELRATNGTYLR